MKFKSDIEVQAGLKDSSGSSGTSGQVLSSTGSNVSWINQTTIASDVQNLVKAGVAINKGQAVYVTGADGTNIIVGLASNTSEATSSKTLGLLNATVAINGMADVVQIGRLAGLNTIGAVAGDPVWLGTNGNLIYGLINKPYAPAHLVFLGIVTRVNANNGEIFVNVQNGFELNEIHDVDLKTNVPINGDVLGFNGTLWVNKTIAQWLGYTPANANGTVNYVSKFTGATTLGDSQIFDNGTNVGIGTNIPSSTLQVGNGTGLKNILISGNGNNLGLGGLSVSFLGFATGTISTVFTSAAVALGVGTRVAQPLILGTNNAERMRIDSSGNVGIGTTTPLFTAFSQLTIKGTDGGLTLQSNSTGVSRIFFAKDETSSTEGLIRYEHSNNSMNFWTSASERMRIASNGAIKFNNYGSGTFTGTATQRLAVDSSGNVIEIPIGGGAVDGSGTTNYVTKWTDTDTIGNSVMYDNGTNVGIGTTSPIEKLDVSVTKSYNQSADIGIALGGTDNGFVDNFSTSSWRQFVSGNASGQSLSFDGFVRSVGWVERMRITSGGNLGIGTSSPNTKLTIEGTLSTKPSGVNAYYSYLRSNWSADNAFELGISDDGVSNFHKLITSSNYYNGSTLQFWTNDSERARFDISGNFGIGTTTPLSRLQIAGALGATVGQGGSTIRLLNTDTGAVAAITAGITGVTNEGMQFSTDGTAKMVINNGNVGIGTTSPGFATTGRTVLTLNGPTSALMEFQNGGLFKSYLFQGPGGFEIYDISNIQFAVNGGERMRITSSGSVGIGTSSPSSLLSVAGNATFGQGANRPVTYDSNGGNFRITANTGGWAMGYYFNGSSGTYRGGFGAYGGADDLGWYFIGSDYNASTATYFLPNGNVGIGTASPFSKMEIAGVATSWSNSPSITLTDSAGTINSRRWLIGNVATDYGSLNFAVSTTNSNDPTNSKMTITKEGNVGIGTTSPAWKLDVSGLGRFRDANTYEGAFIEGTNGVAYFGSLATDAISLYSSGLSRVYINSSGNVGIGTTAPQAKLHINNGADRNLWFRVNGSGTGTELLSINDAQSTRQSLAFSASSFYFDNGNVGIGTTSPNKQLTFAQDDDDAIQIRRFTTSQGNPSIGTGISWTWADASTNNETWAAIRVIMPGSGNSNMTFSTTPSGGASGLAERMRITSSGNVGINTTAPIHKLSVNGKIGGDVYADSFVEFTATTETIVSADGNVVLGYAQNVVVDNEGSLGVGTISPAACAIVEIQSTNQGFLPPRMRTSERDNILGTPKPGLMIFNTDDEVIQVYTDGSGWRTLAFL